MSKISWTILLALALVCSTGRWAQAATTWVYPNSNYTIKVYGFIDPSYRNSGNLHASHHFGERMVVAEVTLPGKAITGSNSAKQVDLSKPFYGMFGGRRHEHRWWGWWYWHRYHGHWWNNQVRNFTYDKDNELYLYFLARETVTHASQGITVRRHHERYFEGDEYLASLDWQTVLYRIYWHHMADGKHSGIAGFVEARTNGMTVPQSNWSRIWGHVHDEWGAMNGQMVPAIPASGTGWNQHSEPSLVHSPSQGVPGNVQPEVIQVPMRNPSLTIRVGDGGFPFSHPMPNLWVTMSPWQALPPNMDLWQAILLGEGNQVQNDSQTAIAGTNTTQLENELDNESQYGDGYDGPTSTSATQVGSSIESSNGGYIFRVQEVRISNDEHIKKVEFIALRDLFVNLDYSRSQNRDINRRHEDYIELNNRIIGGYASGSKIEPFTVTVDPDSGAQRELSASVVVRDGDLDVSFDRMWLPPFKGVVGKPEQIAGIPWQALPTDGMRATGQAIEKVLLGGQGNDTIAVVDQPQQTGTLTTRNDVSVDVSAMKQSLVDVETEMANDTSPEAQDANAEAQAVLAYTDSNDDDYAHSGQGKAPVHHAVTMPGSTHDDQEGASSTITDPGHGMAGMVNRVHQDALTEGEDDLQGRLTVSDEGDQSDGLVIEQAVYELEEDAEPYMEVAGDTRGMNQTIMRSVMLCAGYDDSYFSSDGNPGPGPDNIDNPAQPQPTAVGQHFGLPVYDVEGDGDPDRFYSNDAWSNGFPYLMLEWHKEGHHKKCKGWWGWFSNIDEQRPHNAFGLWGLYQLDSSQHPLGKRLITYGHSRNYDFKKTSEGFLGWKKCVEWWGGTFGFVNGSTLTLRAKAATAPQPISQPVSMSEVDQGIWHRVRLLSAPPADPPELKAPGSYNQANYGYIGEVHRTVFIYQGVDLNMPTSPITDAAGNEAPDFDPMLALDPLNGYMWVETIRTAGGEVGVKNYFWPYRFDPTEIMPSQDPDFYRAVTPSWVFGASDMHDVTPFAERVSGKAIQFLSNYNPHITSTAMGTSVYRFPISNGQRNKALKLLPEVKRAMETEFMGTIVNTASGLGGYVWDVVGDKPQMQWNIAGLGGASTYNLDTDKKPKDNVVLETRQGAGMYDFKGRWHGFSTKTAQRDILKRKWDWHFEQPLSLKIPAFIDYKSSQPQRLSAIPDVLESDDGDIYTDLDIAKDPQRQVIELAAERRKHMMDGGFYLFSGAVGREFELDYACQMPEYITLVCVEWDNRPDRPDVAQTLAEHGKTAVFVGKTPQEQVDYHTTGLNISVAEAQLKGLLNEIFLGGGRTRFKVQMNAQVAQKLFDTDPNKTDAQKRANYENLADSQKNINAINVRDGDSNQNQELKKGGIGSANIRGGPRDDQRLKYAAFPFLADDWLYDQPACHVPYPIFTMNEGQIDVTDEAASLRTTGMVQYRHPMLIYYLDKIETSDGNAVTSKDVSAVYVRYGTDCNPDPYGDKSYALFDLENYSGFQTIVDYSILTKIRWQRFLDWATPANLEDYFLAVFSLQYATMPEQIQLYNHLSQIDLDNVPDPGPEPLAPPEPEWPASEAPPLIAAPVGPRPIYGWSFAADDLSTISDTLTRTHMYEEMVGNPPAPVQQTAITSEATLASLLSTSDQSQVFSGFIDGSSAVRDLALWLQPGDADLEVTIIEPMSALEVSDWLGLHGATPPAFADLYPAANTTTATLADLDTLSLPPSDMPLYLSVSTATPSVDGDLVLGGGLASWTVDADLLAGATVLPVQETAQLAALPPSGQIRIGDEILPYTGVDAPAGTITLGEPLSVDLALGSSFQSMLPLQAEPIAGLLADYSEIESNWLFFVADVAAWDQQQANHEASVAAREQWNEDNDNFLDEYAIWTYGMEIYANQHSHWQAQYDAYTTAATLRDERDTLATDIALFESEKTAIINAVLAEVAALKGMNLEAVVSLYENDSISISTSKYYEFFVDPLNAIPEAIIDPQDLQSWL